MSLTTFPEAGFLEVFVPLLCSSSAPTSCWIFRSLLGRKHCILWLSQELCPLGGCDSMGSSMVGATSLTLTTQLVLTAFIKFHEFSGLGSMWLLTQSLLPHQGGGGIRLQSACQSAGYCATSRLGWAERGDPGILGISACIMK